MNTRPPLTDEHGEVRELTGVDFAHARPANEVLPPDLFNALVAMNKRARGPQKAPTKQAITLRLPPDAIESFKATGAGWQTRIGLALTDWLKTHKPSEITPS
jgi:uncharacterized protein (DUF4415 family)